jgi:thioredoxin reductase (NADPH)
VIIIGAGPAGLAAAMQLNRQGITPLVFERERVGGLLWNANWVENYPGFVDGITGPDLVQLFQDQAARLGVRVQLEEVLKAGYQSDLFRIATSTRDYQGMILVAASGTVPREFPLEPLVEAVREKVFSELAPIRHLRDKEILVVGAGDAALDYALNLASHNKVTILNRGKRIQGLDLLWQRVKKNGDISYFQETEIVGASPGGEGKISLTVRQGSKKMELQSDYLLLAIGRKPEFSYADKSIIDLREKLIREQKLFLIGDLNNGHFRQTSIAVADGIKTAMMIGDLLEQG